MTRCCNDRGSYQPERKHKYQHDTMARMSITNLPGLGLVVPPHLDHSIIGAGYEDRHSGVEGDPVHPLTININKQNIIKVNCVTALQTRERNKKI